MLEDPDEEMKEKLSALIKEAGFTLAALRCGAVLKQFDPPEVPALYVGTSDDFLDNAFDQDFADKGYSGFLEGFDFGTWGRDNKGEDEHQFSTKLYFNGRSPMIRRLAQTADREAVENMVRVLYVHAMLAGHYTLGEREMEILNTGLIKLLEYGLGGKQ